MHLSSPAAFGCNGVAASAPPPITIIPAPSAGPVRGRARKPTRPPRDILNFEITDAMSRLRIGELAVRGALTEMGTWQRLTRREQDAAIVDECRDVLDELAGLVRELDQVDGGSNA